MESSSANARSEIGKGSMAILDKKPRKEKGWCAYHGVEHAWEELPPIFTGWQLKRWCVNCGTSQKLEPPPQNSILSRWVDD
jgi:hypothetical protein